MVDYMFVQGVQFLTTISTKFNYRTVEALPFAHKKGAEKEDIISGINKVITLYQPCGLTVQQINGDNEFECIREDVRPILLNITAADEHVSPVKRSIRSIKDRTRYQIQYLPYAKYQRTMVICCMVFATKTLNNEIGMSPLSNKLSPATLITGQSQPNYGALTSITFGEYVEAYSGNAVTNNNEERTTSALALYPLGNLQKGWMFFPLNTGRVIHRHQWKKLPITTKITHRVEEMATKERQPYISNNFKYKWDSNVMDEEGAQDPDSDADIANSARDSDEENPGINYRIP